MNEPELTALKGSIAKWEGIIAGTTRDQRGTNCPLCKAAPFREAVDDEPQGEDCLGCPVYEKTGFGECIKTPYMQWADHQVFSHNNKGEAMIIQCPTCLELAQAELAFLKSLLPQESV